MMAIFSPFLTCAKIKDNPNYKPKIMMESPFLIVTLKSPPNPGSYITNNNQRPSDCRVLLFCINEDKYTNKRPPKPPNIYMVK